MTPTDRTRNARQSKRRAALNLIAQAAGWQTWSKFETAVINQTTTIGEMTMETNLIETARTNANGRLRARTISIERAARFAALVDEHATNTETHTIRVYSAEGFVANAYKYRAEIAVLEARRNAETGQFDIIGFRVDAKRSHGNGALITINGRAA